MTIHSGTGEYSEMLSIITIWDGHRELGELRTKCIKRVKKVYPSIEFGCISKTKNLPSEIDTIISWEGVEEELWNKWFVKSNEPKVLSDYFRYLYLSKNPYTLYIDTDIYVNEPIEESEYMAKYGGDYCAVWNGNQCSFFEYIVNMRKDNGNLSSISELYPHDCGNLSKYLSHN